MDTVPPTPAFASETDALHMLDSVLGYLAAADPTRVPTQIQARCLTAFERADARLTAARASYLSAFTASQGYREDGAYSARAKDLDTMSPAPSAAMIRGWVCLRRDQPA